MRLYTTGEIAGAVGVTIQHVRNCYDWNVLGGQIVAGAWVSNENQLVAWQSNRKPPKSQPKLYSIKTAAETLGCSLRLVRNAVKRGDIYTTKIPTKGQAGYAHVFTEDQLPKIITDRERPGPDPAGDADAHLALANERYIILGTHNRKGLPYNYKRLAVARRRAREAFNGGLYAEAGEIIGISVPLDDPLIVMLLEGVTKIDQTVIVNLNGERRIYPRHRLERNNHAKAEV